MSLAVSKVAVGTTDTTIYTAGADTQIVFGLVSGSMAVINVVRSGSVTSQFTVSKSGPITGATGILNGDVIHAVAPYGAELAVFTF